MSIDNMPSNVVHALREAGYSGEEINDMSGREAFDAFCTWHGMINWGGTLWKAAIDLYEGNSNTSAAAERKGRV
jgi:hypothetical protein